MKTTAESQPQLYIKCPDCNGDGTLGKSGSRWIACERCGGHEDGQGVGFIEYSIPEKTL